MPSRVTHYTSYGRRAAVLECRSRQPLRAVCSQRHQRERGRHPHRGALSSSLDDHYSPHERLLDCVARLCTSHGMENAALACSVYRCDCFHVGCLATGCDAYCSPITPLSAPWESSLIGVHLRQQPTLRITRSRPTRSAMTSDQSPMPGQINIRPRLFPRSWTAVIPVSSLSPIAVVSESTG